jgi:glyoxylase-like metal-dependent hydrolase (beta-lactamase superfamily II)
MKGHNRRAKFVKIVFVFSAIITISAVCSKDSGKAVDEARSELIQPSKWWESLPRPVYEHLEKVKTDQTWYEVYKLTDDTYAIYEPFQFEEAICYLATGTEKAVVIDTGTGLGDLKKLVGELTDLPVSVINTHTHWDHVGANFQFDAIACYNHPECIGKLTNGVSNERLRPSLMGDSIWKPLPENIDPETWSIPPVHQTRVFENGHTFDLGERTLEVIYTPGHSPGSVCFLDKKNRILFTGDTFFPGPLYVHPTDVNIEDYIASIQKMEARLGEYDHVCSGHNDPWVKSEVIQRVSKAFADIMNGSGTYKEDEGLRRYFFDGFDVLIRTDQIALYQNSKTGK